MHNFVKILTEFVKQKLRILDNTFLFLSFSFLFKEEKEDKNKSKEDILRNSVKIGGNCVFNKNGYDFIAFL